MNLSSLRVRLGAAAVAVTTIALFQAPAPASASARLVAVPQGTSAATLLGGKPLGDTPASTPVDISLVLRARNLAALESRVTAGWKGSYLSTSQFAATYGQTPAVISGIESYLHKFGITTSSYADGLDISANGTAGEINRALSVDLQNFDVEAPLPTGGHLHLRKVFGSLTSPELPAALAAPVLAILGLSNYSPFVSNLRRAQARVELPAARAADAPSSLSNLPSDFVNQYNLTPLENGGATGQGETIGIIALAAIDPSVPMGFWNDQLGLDEPSSRLTIVPLDGGAPGPSADAGTIETDIDVEQSGAIAPSANIRVYSAPDTDPGFADAFFAAASDNIADTVSDSWGASETVVKEAVAQGFETPAYEATFDEALAEMATQGQSTFVAAGDGGAYEAVPDAATTNLSELTPASSPYTTSAGGTTLAGSQTYGVYDADGNLTSTESVDIPAQRAWSWDYVWPSYATLGLSSTVQAATDLTAGFQAGGGGGYSAIEPRPAYQLGISAYEDRPFLQPTSLQQVAPGLILPTAFGYNPAPPLQVGATLTGRGLPDVSADADPATGYLLYDPDLIAGGTQSGWGGTSFVAPQLGGATAVIDSYVGHRVGFWNPTIYALAAGANSPFTPLNDTRTYSGVNYLWQTDLGGNVTALPGEFSNNNLFYTGHPGTIWNPASGLGTPNLTKLAHDFAH